MSVKIVNIPTMTNGATTEPPKGFWVRWMMPDTPQSRTLKRLMDKGHAGIVANDNGTPAAIVVNPQEWLNEAWKLAIEEDNK